MSIFEVNVLFNKKNILHKLLYKTLLLCNEDCQTHDKELGEFKQQLQKDDELEIIVFGGT